MANRHFFFKYRKNNEGLKLWLKNLREQSIDPVKQHIMLAIYFGDWEYHKYANEYLGEECMHTAGDARQVNLFYQLQNSSSDCYFWLFEGDSVYIFYALDLHVTDGEVFDYAREREPEMGSGLRRSYAKTIKCELRQIEKKIELPEMLANLNSNQAYNRGTIRELKDRTYRIADAVINNECLSITHAMILDFLSPIQFETLGFIIFNRLGNYCSSYRGGTLKDYDLRVIFGNSAELKIPFSVETQEWIQVKYKTYEGQLEMSFIVKGNDNGTKQDRVLDKSWIQERCKDPQILEWILKTIYDVRWFKIVDSL